MVSVLLCVRFGVRFPILSWSPVVVLTENQSKSKDSWSELVGTVTCPNSLKIFIFSKYYGRNVDLPFVEDDLS